jgi:hypothetical protein
MRAVHSLGLYNINNPKEIEEFKSILGSHDMRPYELHNTKKKMREYKNCPCFVDWVSFDMILSGHISKEKAQKWFCFFNDKTITSFIDNYNLIKW